VSLKNVMLLAKEKNVQVEQFDLKSYKCVGIIKNNGERINIDFCKRSGSDLDLFRKVY
jgi:hypothetical protein